jgi:hypothetical protein
VAEALGGTGPRQRGRIRKSTVAAEVPGIDERADGWIEGSVGETAPAGGVLQQRVKRRGKRDRFSNRRLVQPRYLAVAAPSAKKVIQPTDVLERLIDGVYALRAAGGHYSNSEGGSHDVGLPLYPVLLGEEDEEANERQEGQTIAY